MSTTNPRHGRPVARQYAKSSKSSKSSKFSKTHTPFKLRLLPLALAGGFALAAVPATTYSQERVTVQSGSWINNSASGLEIIHTGAINGEVKGLINTIVTEYVDNRGIIQTSNGGENSYALHNSSTIKQLNNTGTILSFGHAVYNTEEGKIGSVINGGLMHGTSRHGFYNTGTVSTLTNARIGIISSGEHNALVNQKHIDTLNNSGTIQAGEGRYGIANDINSTIKVLNNSGAILGGNAGVGIFNNGGIGTINNSGIISGRHAIDSNTIGSTLSIVNSGIVAGAVRQMWDGNLNIHGGAGEVFGTFTGLSDSIGTIAAGGNVNFAGGNVLLNSNLSTHDHIVSNTGAVILVTNAIAIRGNFMHFDGTLAFYVSDGAVANGSRLDRGYGSLFINGSTTLGRRTDVALVAPPTYAFAQGQRFVVMSTKGTAKYNEDTLNYSASGYGGTLSGKVVIEDGNSNLVVVLGPKQVEEENTEAESSQDEAKEGVVSDTSAPCDTHPKPVKNSRSSAPINRASTGNANAVFSSLFKYQGANMRLLDVHNAAAAAGSTGEANRLGAQLSPTAVTAGAVQASGAATTAVHNIVSSRLATLRGGGGGSGVSSGESRRAPALWGQLFAGRANQAQRDNVSGYHANYRGMLVGGDVPTAKGWRTGALVSHARTTVGNEGNNSGSSASVDSYGVTGYTSYSGKPGFVNLMAGVTLQRTSTTRAITAGGLSDAAHGSFNGRTYTAAVQGGRPMPLGAATTLTPLAGLVYTTQRQNGYAETGGGGAALKVGGTGSSSLKSDVGFKLERALATSYGTLTPAMQLRWRYEFRDSRLSTTSSFAADTSGATSFTTVGSAAPRNSGALVLSATLARKKNLTLSANYTLEAASGYKAQSGDVRVRWQY